MSNVTCSTESWNNSDYFSIDCFPFAETPVTITLYFLELTLLFTSNYGCVLLVAFLIKVRVFHQNLAVLLENAAFNCVLLCLSRYYTIMEILVVHFLAEAKKLNYYYVCWTVNTFYNVSISNIGLSPIMIVFERVIATIYVKTYERWQNSYIGICCLITQWLMVLFVIVYNELSKSANNMPESITQACYQAGWLSPDITAYILSASMPIGISAMAAFKILLSINKRWYSETFQHSKDHSLSERYQLSENIKTNKFLFPLLVTNLMLNLVGNALGFLLLHLLKQSADSSVQGARATYHIFSLLTASGIACYPFLCMYGHTEMRRRAKASRICFRRGASVEPFVGYQLTNAVGTALIPSKINERELHFAALNEIWNS